LTTRCSNDTGAQPRSANRERRGLRGAGVASSQQTRRLSSSPDAALAAAQDGRGKPLLQAQVGHSEFPSRCSNANKFVEWASRTSQATRCATATGGALRRVLKRQQRQTKRTIRAAPRTNTQRPHWMATGRGACFWTEKISLCVFCLS
jgi:hypothetical protein